MLTLLSLADVAFGRTLRREETLRRMKDHDPDKNGLVTWAEFLLAEHDYTPRQLEAEMKAATSASRRRDFEVSRVTNIELGRLGLSSREVRGDEIVRDRETTENGANGVHNHMKRCH